MPMPKVIDQDLAARIQHEREARGITRAELGRAADVNPSTIWRIENALIQPTIETVRRLAIGLDVPLDSLIF